LALIGFEKVAKYEKRRKKKKNKEKMSNGKIHDNVNYRRSV
jgi:hypothetical protein